MKQIKSVLISVFDKEGLIPLVNLLHKQGVTIYSTGGTQKCIESEGISVISVESLTGYPSILGGRVKTLHPKVFGAILARPELEADRNALAKYHIPAFDMVIVDLYPFEKTAAESKENAEIIEKIDIGGISLIRAAAKNFNDVWVVSSPEQYSEAADILTENKGFVPLAARQKFAAQAFNVSSHYDTAIFNYFNNSLPAEAQILAHKASISPGKQLRYGENPHQKGIFFGNLDALFDKLSGKALSYNNLVDIDAALALIDEFPAAEGAAFAILKHNNACGMAVAPAIETAYQNALKADPVSAFGGVLVSNSTLNLAAAQEIDRLFFEVLVAPDFESEALACLKRKKKRILLRRKTVKTPVFAYKTLLNGVIGQEKDTQSETDEDLKTVTKRRPTAAEVRALLFANKLVKHTKSNTIVLAQEGQLLASGTGQTARVDALEQAIHKAKHFGFDLRQAVMASDAFFPFPDCVEIAQKAGIKAVIQPGGSIRDQESIDFCDAHGMTMVTTGFRHFKH